MRTIGLGKYPVCHHVLKHFQRFYCTSWKASKKGVVVVKVRDDHGLYQNVSTRVAYWAIYGLGFLCWTVRSDMTRQMRQCSRRLLDGHQWWHPGFLQPYVWWQWQSPYWVLCHGRLSPGLGSPGDSAEGGVPSSIWIVCGIWIASGNVFSDSGVIWLN